MRRLSAIGLLLFAAACSEPPQKEIDQAQSAVDAARTAGAAEYARDEYVAATASLQKAHDSVNQRDYRQALSYALDARERAREAVRQTADAKSTARAAAEARITALAVRSQQLDARLKAADAARIPPRELRGPRGVLGDTRTRLQKARAAMGSGNFQDASKTLDAIGPALDAAIQNVEAVMQRPSRRRR